MKRIILIAIEQDGLNRRLFPMEFKVSKTCTVNNLKTAVKAACEEYIQTPEGKETYMYNCNNFNWADFWTNVPNKICSKHGFCKMTESDTCEEVDWDEQLV